jgi:hypothetical protein
MSEKKNDKRWMVVFFPQGPFNGKINTTLDGKKIVSAKEAVEIINAAEEDFTNP